MGIIKRDSFFLFSYSYIFNASTIAVLEWQSCFCCCCCTLFSLRHNSIQITEEIGGIEKEREKLVSACAKFCLCVGMIVKRGRERIEGEYILWQKCMRSYIEL